MAWRRWPGGGSSSDSNGVSDGEGGREGGRVGGRGREREMRSSAPEDVRLSGAAHFERARKGVGCGLVFLAAIR